MYKTWSLIFLNLFLRIFPDYLRPRGRVQPHSALCARHCFIFFSPFALLIFFSFTFLYLPHFPFPFLLPFPYFVSGESLACPPPPLVTPLNFVAKIMFLLDVLNTFAVQKYYIQTTHASWDLLGDRVSSICHFLWLIANCSETKIIYFSSSRLDYSPLLYYYQHSGIASTPNCLKFYVLLSIIYVY